MSDYLKKPLSYFLEDLSSHQMSPGGGSAAALTLALSASLLEMTAKINSEREKKKTEKISKETLKNLARLKGLRQKASKLITLDAVIFLKESKNFKLGKESAAHQKALKNCLKTPFEICKIAYELTDITRLEKSRTSAWLMSDLLEASLFLQSAFKAARLNAEINLNGLLDKEIVADKRIQLDLWEEKVNQVKEFIWDSSR